MQLQREGEGPEGCGVRVAAVISHKGLSLLILKGAPLTPEPPFSPPCSPAGPGEAIDPEDCILAVTGWCFKIERSIRGHIDDVVIVLY